jgi:hypothetical protein
MSPADPFPGDLARAFVESWARSDLDDVAARVAETITYEGPMARAVGVDAYLDVVGPFSYAVDRVNILGVAEARDQAIVMYEIETSAFGTVAAAEMLRFEGGLIVSSRLIFDSYPVRVVESAR